MGDGATLLGVGHAKFDGLPDMDLVGKIVPGGGIRHGIAHAMDDDHRITRDGDAIGTPTWMSPEQALGLPHVDARANIYSLGVVGYRMLAGVPPFTAANVPALLTMHVTKRAEPLVEKRPETPRDLVDAIERAMEKKPEHRWPTMSAFRTALGAAPAPARAPTRFTAAYPAAVTGPARSVRERVAQFRDTAIESAALTALLALLNAASAPLDREAYGWLLYSADNMVLKLVATLLALNLLVLGIKLHSEDVSFSELLFGHRRADDEARAPELMPPTDCRYDTPRRQAEREFLQIGEIIARLPEDKRALVPAVAPSARSLKELVDKLAGGMRAFESSLVAEGKLGTLAVSRLNSAVDALRALRLGLQELEETGSIAGAERLNATADRVHSRDQ